jgi:hypothetical protein
MGYPVAILTSWLKLELGGMHRDCNLVSKLGFYIVED